MSHEVCTQWIWNQLTGWEGSELSGFLSHSAFTLRKGGRQKKTVNLWLWRGRPYQDQSSNSVKTMGKSQFGSFDLACTRSILGAIWPSITQYLAAWHIAKPLCNLVRLV